MQLSRFMLPIISLMMAVPSNGAPTDVAKRDGAVVKKLTTTLLRNVVHTEVKDAATSTWTDTLIDTSTQTVTRYTATVTSVVYAKAGASPPTGTSPDTTSSSTSQTTQQQQAQTTKKAQPSTTSSSSSSSSSTPASSSSTPATKPAPSPTQSTTQATQAPDETTSSVVGPTITDIANIPSSTGSWLIDNVSTSKSDGVCIVDYDYYGTDEIETTTNYSTVYVTSTIA